MTELLNELKSACGARPAVSNDELIARGGSTWFRGTPAPAENGTVALGLGREARVVIRERDIRTVTREGEHYNVEVSSEANVLLRIEKPVKAAIHPKCGCKRGEPAPGQTRSRKSEDIDLDFEIISICDLICVDVVVDNGKQSVKCEICFPVNCEYY